MRSGKSETLLLLPLLPIFLVGMFPMLLLGMLGFAGLVIFGILLICVGLTDTLEANSDFNEQVIVHGYARRSERAVQRDQSAVGNPLRIPHDRRGHGHDRRRALRAFLRLIEQHPDSLRDVDGTPRSRTRRLRSLPKFAHGHAARGGAAASRLSATTL